MTYYVPRLKKWGGHAPASPHEIAPMCGMMQYYAISSNYIYVMTVWW